MLPSFFLHLPCHHLRPGHIVFCLPCCFRLLTGQPCSLQPILPTAAEESLFNIPDVPCHSPALKAFTSWAPFALGCLPDLIYSAFNALLWVPIAIRQTCNVGFHTALRLELSGPVGPYGSRRQGPYCIPRCSQSQCLLSE